MLIKIDCREIKLQQLCHAQLTDTPDTIKLVSESLPLGDIIICDDHGNEKVLIERKSLADLAASIRDGRYSEQGFRLNHCSLHNHQIYYVIEGDLRYYRPFKGLPDKKALLSAMVSMSYFKGFSLYRTINLEETAEWILHFAKKIQKEGVDALPFYTQAQVQAQQVQAQQVQAQQVQAQQTEAQQAEAQQAHTEAQQAQAQAQAQAYANVVASRVKKDYITPENIGEIMLAQIPSVSSASASAIMKKFSTIANLFTALQQDPACLNDITMCNKNGQAKKLTKPCINNIYDFLIKPTIISVNT
jgi:ERCC4-type nuclease